MTTVNISERVTREESESLSCRIHFLRRWTEEVFGLPRMEPTEYVPLYLIDDAYHGVVDSIKIKGKYFKPYDWRPLTVVKAYLHREPYITSVNRKLTRYQPSSVGNDITYIRSFDPKYHETLESKLEIEDVYGVFGYYRMQYEDYRINAEGLRLRFVRKLLLKLGLDPESKPLHTRLTL